MELNSRHRSHNGAYCEIPGNFKVRIRNEGVGQVYCCVCQFWRKCLDPWVGKDINPATFLLLTTTNLNLAVSDRNLGNPFRASHGIFLLQIPIPVYNQWVYWGLGLLNFFDNIKLLYLDHCLLTKIISKWSLFNLQFSYFTSGTFQMAKYFFNGDCMNNIFSPQKLRLNSKLVADVSWTFW